MVDIVARTNLLPTPQLVVYRDAAELDIVARAAFNAYPDLNAYGRWWSIPPGSTASTPTIIVITIGRTADVASAQALNKVKLGRIGNATEIDTAYALVFTVDTGTGPSIQYRRYLFSPLLRKSTNRYPLGTMK